MSDEEVWKEIPGWEGSYDASNMGKVRRSFLAAPCKSTYPGRILGDKSPDSHTGYMRITLRCGSRTERYQIHRLIAATFMNPIRPGLMVNHKDGIKTNNKLENLEWATAQENVRHAWRTGLCHAAKGSRNGHSTLTEETAKIALGAIARGVPGMHVAQVFNVSHSAISSLINGKTWTHLHKETA